MSQAVVPVNFRPPDASPEAISRDVAYALGVFDSYTHQVPGGLPGLTGLRVLELGPGTSLGTAVLLACGGARIAVADRFLAPWTPSYHGPFFRFLLRRLEHERRDLDPSPILAILRGRSFVHGTVARHPLSAEELDELPPGSFDLVLSNAVLEHVRDHGRALAGIQRATAPGGLGLHQIDFRDHRDYSRPLEFLTMDAISFQAEFERRSCECGNRVRHFEIQRELERLGCTVECVPNIFATDEYLSDVRPRLHADYQRFSDEQLRVVSALFRVRAPGGVAGDHEGRELTLLRRQMFATQVRLGWAEADQPIGRARREVAAWRDRLRWTLSAGELALEQRAAALIPALGPFGRLARPLARLARRRSW